MQDSNVLKRRALEHVFGEVIGGFYEVPWSGNGRFLPFSVRVNAGRDRRILGHVYGFHREGSSDKSSYRMSSKRNKKIERRNWRACAVKIRVQRKDIPELVKERSNTAVTQLTACN